MAMMLDPAWAEALNFLGFNWPTSNEDTLGELADELRTMATTIEEHGTDLEAAVRHVMNNNEGDYLETAVNRLRGQGSEIDVLAGIGEGAQMAATAADAAAILVVGMKIAVGVQLALTAASLLTGPLSVFAKLAAQYAINFALDKVANKILGDA